MDIKGKVVIVTGASSGIGEATARQFAREGAKVVLAARRVDRLEALAKEITSMGTGAEAFVVQADLSKLEDIQSLINQTLEKFGRIDVLVNNAGFGRIDWLEKLDPVKDIQGQFDVNVMGVIQTTRQALPVMIKQRSGSIINMCSMAGLVASQGLGIYNTTKYAVVGLSETLAKDLRPHGIGVSVLCPMGVATRIGEAERSRPAALRDPAGRERAPSVQLIGRTLTAEEVAEQALAAIRERQLYVITHEEGLEPLRRRCQRLEAAVKRCAGKGGPS